jgi:hypothetical protein
VKSRCPSHSRSLSHSHTLSLSHCISGFQIHTRTHARTRARKHASANAHARTQACVCLFVHTYIHIPIHRYMDTNTYLHTCVYECAHMCTCIYVRMSHGLWSQVRQVRSGHDELGRGFWSQVPQGVLLKSPFTRDSMHVYCSLTEHTHAHSQAHAYQLWSNSTRKQTRQEPTRATFDTDMHVCVKRGARVCMYIDMHVYRHGCVCVDVYRHGMEGQGDNTKLVLYTQSVCLSVCLSVCKKKKRYGH